MEAFLLPTGNEDGNNCVVKYPKKIKTKIMRYTVVS